MRFAVAITVAPFLYGYQVKNGRLIKVPQIEMQGNFGKADIMSEQSEKTETHLYQAMIKLNGEIRSVTLPKTVAQLVEELGLIPAKVAVERNMEIVTRSTLADVQLADGDALEIVHFVGGG